MCAGIITFCTAFGIFISNMGERGKIMMDFFTCLNEIIMKLVALVMWYVIAAYVTWRARAYAVTLTSAFIIIYLTHWVLYYSNVFHMDLRKELKL